MAGRQRPTFQKRLKEMKRLEKQRLKAEKRQARRLEKRRNNAPMESEYEPVAQQHAFDDDSEGQAGNLRPEHGQDQA